MKHTPTGHRSIAYFSMEIGIDEKSVLTAAAWASWPEIPYVPQQT